MSTTVDVAFIKQYEREVHLAFQRMGSDLLRTIRRNPNVVGTTTTFQKLAKGVATTKSRNGTVTPMNVTHTNVSATMVDFYAGDWADRLDLAKVNIDERGALARTGAFTLGRKVDNQLVTAMDGTTTTGTSTSSLTLANVLEGFETLGDNDVFEAGRMYFAVPYNGWADLLQINQFASADFVREGTPWPEGKEAKRWLGALVFPTTAVNDVKSGSTFKSFFYHEDSVGYGHNANITADITWHGDRVSWFVNHFMSGGAVLIDANGCHEHNHT